MATVPVLLRERRFFYGWYVLISSAVMLFFIQGARVVLGVIFKPVVQELGWNRSALSLAALANMVVFALSLTLVGRLYDRWGARWVLIVATLFLAGGFVGASMATAAWQFVFFYGFLAALGFGGTSVPLFGALTGKWFHRHRGLAVSLALAGGCLGQYVLVPAATRMVLAYGWRFAIAGLGAAVLVVDLLLTLIWIKDDPEDLGLRPYGADDDGPPSAGRPPTVLAFRQDLGLAAAMRTRSFWCYLVVMSVCGGGDYLFLTHLIPMVTDHGVSAMAAGRMLGWAGLCSLAGVVMTGPLTDRFGNKAIVVVTFALRAAIFLLIFKYKSFPAFYSFAVLFGFTIFITAPITTTLLGKLYGFRHIGLLSGFITTIHHLSGGLWAYLGGLNYDRTGNYDLSFLISIASAVTAMIAAMLIREQRHL